jgi:hypothetical protein
LWLPVYAEGSKYVAFAVAANEASAVSVGEAGQAWIAVAVEGVQSRKHEVLLFNPLNSRPVARHNASDKVNSLVFCPGSSGDCEQEEQEDATHSQGEDVRHAGQQSGLALVTESCELLFLSPMGTTTATTAPAGGKVAWVRTTSTFNFAVLSCFVLLCSVLCYCLSCLCFCSCCSQTRVAAMAPGLIPAVGAVAGAADMFGANSSSSSVVQRGGAVAGTLLQPAAQGWLKNHFDERSENIPTLGALSGKLCF